MSRPWVRLSSVIIMLVVVFTTGYRLLHSERQRNLEHAATSAYTSLAWTLTVGLADIRAAQQAYVANGQDPDEWYARVTTQLGGLKDGLSDLRAMSQSSEAVEAIVAAEALVEQLRRVDESARDHTTIGQVLMASDLVFIDGQGFTRQAAEQLDLARSVESEARIRSFAERRAHAVTTAAVATIVGVGVAFALLPLPGRPPELTRPTITGHALDTPETSTAAAGTGAVPLDPTTVLMPVDLALNRESTLTREESIASVDKVDPARDRDKTSASMVVPDLTTTAQLCTDLGRVSESHQLDDVLSRASNLLNASGLIVWVRDSSGRALRPATGHGYAPQVLSRLGPVACDGESATATAFRTARLQVVPGGENGPGAMALPLISSASDTGRCVGVLSAEVRHGWETSDAVQATATILAAQLATFVTTDPLSAEREARDQAQAHG